MTCTWALGMERACAGSEWWESACMWGMVICRFGEQGEQFQKRAEWAIDLPMPRTSKQSSAELLLLPPHALPVLVVALKAATAVATDCFGVPAMGMLPGCEHHRDEGEFQLSS